MPQVVLTTVPHGSRYFLTRFSHACINSAFHLALHLCTVSPRTTAFGLLSISHGILERGFRIRSHFRINCTLSAFSHAATGPHSRVRTHFYSLRSRSAFDGRILAAFALSQYSRPPPLPPFLAYERILAAFAHSQHSTVAFWQLSLTLSIRRSHFGSLFSLSILAPRRCPPSSRTIAFWQLLLSQNSRLP